FTGYHNGSFGVDHGAYLNQYTYEGAILYGNMAGALNVHALSKGKSGALRFTGLRCDGAGLADYGVVVPNHVQASTRPTEILGCSFRGHRLTAVSFVGGGKYGHIFDLVDSSFGGNEFWLASEVPEGSYVRVQDAAHGSISLERADRPGELNVAWNARVNPIAAFASSG
ncbi:MAG: hypothetical protein ACR2G7_02690, partial [Acidimicrobiales bacterium]